MSINRKIATRMNLFFDIISQYFRRRNKEMKKILASLVLTALIAGSLTGCSKNPENIPTGTTVPANNITIAQATTTETTEDPRGHYEFKPIVMSSIFKDIMGEDMYWAYCNYVNAVRNKEDSFEVKSEKDYDWMIGQFPTQFYPIYGVYTESNYAGAFKDGRATFQYKIDKEELAAKEKEFEKTVMNIVNENIRDDYSDFEKVLALYLYFAKTYSYDYDALNMDPIEKDKKLSSYRFFFDKKGICFECAGAFNYLLLQAGVDVTSGGGYSYSGKDGHAWSYVTINGKNYHVDPTYVMGQPGNLTYLMMTDSKREIEGDYKKNEMSIACHYKEDHNGSKYDADDDFFSPLWGGTLTSWDHKKNVIYYTDFEGNEKTFDYSKFG